MANLSRRPWFDHSLNIGSPEDESNMYLRNVDTYLEVNMDYSFEDRHRHLRDARTLNLIVHILFIFDQHRNYFADFG